MDGFTALNGRLQKALLVFLLPVLMIAGGCGNKVSPGTAEVKRTEVTGVTLFEIRPSQVNDYVETSGTVKAKNIGIIASRIMGSVTSVAVQEGSQVKSGQLLMTVDDRDIAQKVSAAQSAVESARQQKQLAEVTSSRYEKLYEEKALSRQEFDQVETQKKVAQNEYERANAQLREAREVHGYARIKAPFAGVVTAKKIDAGSMAVPGMQLLTVEDTSSFIIETTADERLSAGLKPGTVVDVTIDSIGRDIKGKVSEVVPAIDPATRTFLAKIAIRGDGLKTGLYAKVRIPSGAREALTVPSSSIVEKGQLTGVYSVDSRGVISYRLVRIGKLYEDNIEILSGLAAGDSIITSGLDRAVDGGIVRDRASAVK